jgi:hypothetical protein
MPKRENCWLRSIVNLPMASIYLISTMRDGCWTDFRKQRPASVRFGHPPLAVDAYTLEITKADLQSIPPGRRRITPEPVIGPRYARIRSANPPVVPRRPYSSHAPGSKEKSAPRCTATLPLDLAQINGVSFHPELDRRAKD